MENKIIEIEKILDNNMGIMKNISNYIFSSILITFFIIGICLVILPKRYFNKKKKICNVQVKANVIELKQKKQSANTSSTTLFSPTYEFFYNNIEYKVNLETYGNYGVPSIGDEITININPYNPEEIYIPNTKGEKFLKNILLFMGLGFIIFTVILTVSFRGM